jgi:hypothetical protein
MCRQPDADAVVHQYLHVFGAPIGEQIGMVPMAVPKTLITRVSAKSVLARMSNGLTASQAASTRITCANLATTARRSLRHRVASSQ